MWHMSVFCHPLGSLVMFITVLYQDSCNYHESLVNSVRRSSNDKEVLIALLMLLCEPSYSPGNNSNV